MFLGYNVHDYLRNCNEVEEHFLLSDNGIGWSLSFSAFQSAEIWGFPSFWCHHPFFIEIVLVRFFKLLTYYYRDGMSGLTSKAKILHLILSTAVRFVISCFYICTSFKDTCKQLLYWSSSYKLGDNLSDSIHLFLTSLRIFYFISYLNIVSLSRPVILSVGCCPQGLLPCYRLWINASSPCLSGEHYCFSSSGLLCVRNYLGMALSLSNIYFHGRQYYFGWKPDRSWASCCLFS